MSSQDCHSIYSSAHPMWTGANERPETPATTTPAQDAAWRATVIANDARIEAMQKAIEQQQRELEDALTKRRLEGLPHPSTMPEPRRSEYYDEIWGTLSHKLNVGILLTVLIGRPKHDGRSHRAAASLVAELSSAAIDIYLSTIAELAERKRHPVAVLEDLLRDLHASLIAHMEALEDNIRDPVTGEMLVSIQFRLNGETD